jgi:hypothetical protein
MATIDAVAAAEAMMQKIDEDPAASGDVSRPISIEYYRQIASMCDERADQIESEMEDDGEEE